eukprot:1395316-Amorphochlora_amoeboformis.AAC.1
MQADGSSSFCRADAKYSPLTYKLNRHQRHRHIALFTYVCVIVATVAESEESRHPRGRQSPGSVPRIFSPFATHLPSAFTCPNARIYSGQLTAPQLLAVPASYDTFAAVMGASGSGKTSFLDVLASRATRTGTPIVTGSVWLNEEEAPDVSAIAPWAAYVTQEVII